MEDLLLSTAARDKDDVLEIETWFGENPRTNELVDFAGDALLIAWGCSGESEFSMVLDMGTSVSSSSFSFSPSSDMSEMSESSSRSSSS